MKKRWSSLLLCAAMLVSLCAPAAAEEDTVEETGPGTQSVEYRDEKGETKNCAQAITVTADKTTWGETDGRPHWYVAQGTMDIKDRVTVEGDVHLILVDECTLGATVGINVGEGNSLSIYAQSTDERTMGKLTATGGGYDAGIEVNAGSTVTIHGGKVTATGNFGAGIGGHNEKAGGSINILGGTVAASSQLGAGIGGGWRGGGGNITISGGMVTATSQSYGAGIGGGQIGSGGKITITGGKVTATSQSEGAGIGGGAFRDGGEITISGGEVTATSKGNSAGIGGGGRGTGGEITINGGTVKATGQLGAGIGGGENEAGGEITINGGTVEATSSTGAGIGGGDGGGGGEITISGGTVRATSGNDKGDGGDGAGIGGGCDGVGEEITITGGTVTATSGSDGAGIGGGCDGDGGRIIISGGTVTATSDYDDAGIGGGYSGDSGNFTADGNAFITASSIQNQDGKGQWSGVIFEGVDGRVYGSPITLATDAEIPANRTLEIRAGQTLIIGEGVTLTNYGKITGSGTIKGTVVNHGTIEDGVTVQDHSHQWNTAWSSDSTHHWHRCTVAGCGERRDTAAHTPGEWIIDREATSSSTGSRHKACTVCGYTMETETIPATGGSTGGGRGGGTYTPPTYPPTVEKPSGGGGTPFTSPSNPKQGDTVTVTPKPNDGYQVDRITVTDRNGRPVEVTMKPDGTYTFQQPSGKVTIGVTYRPIDRPWNNPFADVSEGDWYYEAVRFVNENGLMGGYGNGRFGVNDNLSRAQLAQILFNKEGRPAVSGGGFNDVDSSAWYADAVTWAAENGIVGGYGNGIFGPNDPITREQLAVMLWRYSGSPAATNKELRFDDADEISPFALEALRWAVENGVLNGYGDGRLGPQGRATRAQVAQMLKNFIENQEEENT